MYLLDCFNTVLGCGKRHKTLWKDIRHLLNRVFFHFYAAVYILQGWKPKCPKYRSKYRSRVERLHFCASIWKHILVMYPLKHFPFWQGSHLTIFWLLEILKCGFPTLENCDWIDELLLFWRRSFLFLTLTITSPRVRHNFWHIILTYA